MLEEVGEAGAKVRGAAVEVALPRKGALIIASLTPRALSTCSGLAPDSQIPCALPPLLECCLHVMNTLGRHWQSPA